MKEKGRTKKGDVAAATALAQTAEKKTKGKKPATPNSKCAIIQTYKCTKHMCLRSYIHTDIGSVNEYECKKQHYDKQTHIKDAKAAFLLTPRKVHLHENS